MLIVADDKIKDVGSRVADMGDVLLVPGHEITRDHLMSADALLVRSVTRVNTPLLKGTTVRFVGTATAGTDHVSTADLDMLGITFAGAPGCNARAVSDYIMAALSKMARTMDRPILDLKVGIVGMGNVGRTLYSRLDMLGMKTVINDPPLAEEGPVFDFEPLDVLLAEADVVTVLTPLVTSPPHPTTNLIDQDEIGRMRPGTALINTARGGVVNERALIAALASGHLAGAAVDVWDREPDINFALVERATITTPHIAGYGAESKSRATSMILEALAAWAGKSISFSQGHAQTRPIAQPLSYVDEAPFVDQLIRMAYDIEADHQALQQLRTRPEKERASHFRDLRNAYVHRKEFSSHTVTGSLSKCRLQLVKSLGMKST